MRINKTKILKEINIEKGVKINYAKRDNINRGARGKFSL